MALRYNDQTGMYEDENGNPVFNSGGESGYNWMSAGNESVAPVSYGAASAPSVATAPNSSNAGYVVRGNYRMPKSPFGGTGSSGALEVMDANGAWVPVTAANAPAGYDPRQDSNTQGSNERLRFDQAFGTAPADVPITGMQQWAMANGWTEPDRSNNEGTLGSMIKTIAPYAGLMAGGIGAMGGFGGGLLGASEGLANPGYIDALGGMTDVTGTALPGWANTAGAAGSGAMDWSGYIDALGGMTDATGTALPGWGAESLAIPDYIDALGGMTDASGTALPSWSSGDAGWLDTLKSALSSNGSGVNTLKSLLSGSGTGGTDLMKLLGGLGSSALGAYASDKQTTALEDQAKRYEGYGAPYRQRLSDLYANPSSFLTSPEVKTSVDQGTNSLMRSLSMTGNPFGSGNALQQGQNYASDQLFGKLGQEKDRLANFGGLSTYNSAAPTAATNAIGSSANTYNAIGSGLGNIFNPPQTTAQTMAEFMKAMKG